jgi:hypothetical protein
MLTYAEMETTLARAHGADEGVQRNAFRGCLKHLLRLGIPLNCSPGKGAKISYSSNHLWQLAFCLEMEQCGIAPTAIARLIHESWMSSIGPRLRDSIVGFENELFCIVYPKLMSASFNDDVAPLLFDFLNRKSTGFLELLLNSRGRAIAINLSAIGRLTHTMSGISDIASDVPDGWAEIATANSRALAQDVLNPSPVASRSVIERNRHAYALAGVDFDAR